MKGGINNYMSNYKDIFLVANFLEIDSSKQNNNNILCVCNMYRTKNYNNISTNDGRQAYCCKHTKG